MQFENVDDKKARPLFAPPRDHVTANQLGMLLNTARTLMSCITGPVSPFSSEDSEGTASDGGAKCAAETTFIKVCGRIDDIIDDKSRWDMKGQDTLEKEMAGMLKAQSEQATMMRRMLNNTQLPHIRLKPKLYKVGHAWVACHGNICDRRACVVAVGVYPQEALNYFDWVFMGRDDEHKHQNILDELLAEANTQRKDLHEIKMDRIGGQQSPPSEGQGQQLGGYSRGDGPQL